MFLNMVQMTLLIALCCLAAGFDLLARRVPNMLLAVIGLTSLVGQVISVTQAGQIIWGQHLFNHLLGAMIGLIVLMPFWLIGWMGAGDVKLFSLFGLMLGYQALLPIWVIASVIAGLHAVVVLMTRTQPVFSVAEAWLDSQRWYQRFTLMRQGRSGIPYAAYLSIGALLTMHYSL